MRGSPHERVHNASHDRGEPAELQTWRQATQAAVAAVEEACAVLGRFKLTGALRHVSSLYAITLEAKATPKAFCTSCETSSTASLRGVLLAPAPFGCII
jgi:ferric-dicitrate binding protein FerR (iron transport regulator)